MQVKYTEVSYPIFFSVQQLLLQPRRISNWHNATVKSTTLTMITIISHDQVAGNIIRLLHILGFAKSLLAFCQQRFVIVFCYGRNRRLFWLCFALWSWRYACCTLLVKRGYLHCLWFDGAVCVSMLPVIFFVVS